MSDKPPDDWPPLISNAHRTAWVRWRGFAITVAMWGLFCFVLAREIDLLWQALQLLARRPVEKIDPGLEEFLVGLKPALWVILILVTVLGVSTVVSWRRRNAALLQPPPAPLSERDLADDLGLSEQELNELRARTIVVLDVDEQGRVCRTESRQAPSQL